VTALFAVDPLSVAGLAAEAEAADGVAPLSGHVLDGVAAGTVQVLTHSAEGQTDPVGVLALPTDDPAELFVLPGARRQGIGGGLVHEALDRAGRVWAHGNLPAARALADALGLRRVRELLQMSRPTEPDHGSTGWPAAPVPSGVAIRTFRDGQDDDSFLAVNARAFAWHPEQGRLDAAGLELEKAQDWFEPAGFFVAVDGADNLLGFHWTKVHPAAPGAAGPVGEIYVLAVDPEATVSGLGRALTRIGLEHLRERGVSSFMLYVEGDNERALRLYRGFGFTVSRSDVVYAR
jgi:mycothiol synthase